MNKVMLIGRTCTKPVLVEYEKEQRQIKTARVLLAVEDDSKPETSDFINLRAYGKLAEVVEKYMEDSRYIAVEGKIKSKTYEKESEKKYWTEVVMTRIKFLDKKRSEEVTTVDERLIEISEAELEQLPFD